MSVLKVIRKENRKTTWLQYAKTQQQIKTEMEKLLAMAPQEIALPHAVFSPMILPCLMKLIHEEKERIYGACYEFDDVRLAEPLIQARNNEIMVNLIVNGASRQEKGPITFIVDLLLKNGIKVFDSFQRYDDTDLAYGNHRELMHHKFIIFSKNGSAEKPLLVTGSYNWTKNACKNNWENVVILNDPTVIFRFLEQWLELKEHSKAITMTAGV